MPELLLKMFEAAKKDKEAFMMIKKLVVRLQQYELAAEIRDIEKELFD